MCIGIDGRLAGIFTLTDKLRMDAGPTIAHLQAKGYTVHMLSGEILPMSWLAVTSEET